MENKKTIEKNLHSVNAQEISTNYDMVVFCHLRWDFVYQRPQHLITRLSKVFNILVVEEPITPSGESTYDLTKISPNLTILRPKVESIIDISDVLSQLKLKKFSHAWFYSAAFVDLLPFLKVDTIIYDCMDELSQFKGASPKLKSQEKLLIEEADVIFTGGKSLYEEKAKLSSNVHCFPSSVDVEHFGRATHSTAMPEDLMNITKPIIGYIGVIDERIDYELLQMTAQLSSDFAFVMIGPVVKVNESDLPREENIHYLGMKGYKDLPEYLNAFTIAMMPFALNEATQYISPTKTLEYMAAGKPIISTAIKDVVRDYNNVVSIVSSANEFVDAIKNITNSAKNNLIEYKRILDQTSWDNTANSMINILNTVSK